MMHDACPPLLLTNDRSILSRSGAGEPPLVSEPTGWLLPPEATLKRGSASPVRPAASKPIVFSHSHPYLESSGARSKDWLASAGPGDKSLVDVDEGSASALQVPRQGFLRTVSSCMRGHELHLACPPYFAFVADTYVSARQG